MGKEVTDVEEVVTPTTEGEEVETKPEDGDDKSKNFARLRGERDDLKAENERLRKIAETEEGRDLRTQDEQEDDVVEKADTEKIVFDRDLKEATLQWNEKNQVSKEEWAQIRKKVSLTGKETLTEIKRKISEAHESIPSVRKAKEDGLREEGRQEILKRHTDLDLDIGGGSDGSDLGEGGIGPSFTPKEKAWLDKMNVKPEDRKKIDKSANPNEWNIHDEGPERGIRRDS